MSGQLLILMRHGESLWNLQNVFTGWVDVPLSSKGIDEALAGGDVIADIPIDVCFTSTLIRAQMTLMLAMSRHRSKKVPVMMHVGEGKLDEWGKIYSAEAEATVIPVYTSWHLNERMYGELQGCNKAETAEKFGADQVKIWRRSYNVPPPSGESLEMTAKRTLPYFNEEIKPSIERGKNVLIAAHGNSLRSIVMSLDNLTEDQVLALEIPTGQPIFYTYRNGRFERLQEPLHAHRHLSR